MTEPLTTHRYFQSRGFTPAQVLEAFGLHYPFSATWDDVFEHMVRVWREIQG